MATYTITWNNKTVNVTGLPDTPVRNWHNNFTIKFYHRGKRSFPTLTKTGKFKAPRRETQIYVNGKYFLQLIWDTTPENEETIKEIMIYLYCFGCDLEEIQRIVKTVFYQNPT